MNRYASTVENLLRNGQKYPIAKMIISQKLERHEESKNYV